MKHTEFTANEHLSTQAAERARFAAVLAPMGKPARRVAVKPAGLLARVAALFA